ncbi:MAG TPA: toprim domain-containing protein [Thermoanaerobaculia bacterium]|nr:toprim domain-containing protein [Thermoanaerobaculia bacterium]
MTIRRKRGGGAQTYTYTDEEGRVLFQVVRKVNPTKFFQRRPDGKDGWINSLKDVRRVLYRLPEVLAAVRENQPVYVVEGERDADNLAHLGLVVTTNSGGPGRWRKDLSKSLHGARVVILPDNDDEGREHAQKVAKALHEVAAEVRVLELPDLPDGGDVSDWIETMGHQGAGDEEIRAELERLVAKAAVWEPSGDGIVNQPRGVERVEEALQALWALGKDPKPAAVERALTRVAADLEGCHPLALQTAREVAVSALKGKVKAPARFVDAALDGVTVARQSPLEPDSDTETSSPYLATDDGLIHIKSTRDGIAHVPLTNFTAKIVGEVRHDDGVEVQRTFEVAARHQGQEHQFEVTSGDFAMMRWVPDKLGARAIVNAGMGTRDHARAAIQHLSDRVAVRTVYTHLGWREVGTEWVYLHADGAIGTVGTVSGIEVDPPEQLRLYTLPDPPTGKELTRAIRASLRCLPLLPDWVTVPTYCTTWRAPLGPSDFSTHLAGRTGEGKTEVAALQAQHFGPGLDARNLPGSWTSTGNSLEVLAFHAKDCLLVVDDFAPGGTAQDVQRLHREAARLLRSKGNQAGRGRLRPDSTLQPDKPPRGLILSSGEDVPSGHSVRARLLVLEVPAGEMNWELLTQCQKDAGTGFYAQAMAGYVRWLAPRYQEVQKRLRSRVTELRAQATATAQHRRTPSIVADLAFGMEVFLAYALDVGALERAEAESLWERTWKALGNAAALQAAHLEAADPVVRFLELLRAALVSGGAHVASTEGGEPEKPQVWGWREKSVSGILVGPAPWLYQGDRIGWVDGNDLYLDPEAAYRVAQRMSTQDGLSVMSRTLWKRLKEAGILVTTDETRQRNTVRVTLQGERREVLHLHTRKLLSGKPSQPSQPSQGGGGSGVPAMASWDGFGSSGQEPSHETVPEEGLSAAGSDLDGTVGTVGTVSRTTEPASEEPWGEV